VPTSYNTVFSVFRNNTSLDTLLYGFANVPTLYKWYEIMAAKDGGWRKSNIKKYIKLS